MRVTLATAVARRVATFLASTQVVPHVLGQDAVLDQDVSRTWSSLVVHREVSPFTGHRAVVDQRHQGTGHLLADLAGVHRGLLQDGVGLEAVSTRLVKEDAARSAGQYHGQVARGRWARGQLGDGLLRGPTGGLFDGLWRQEFEASRSGQGAVPGLHTAVTVGHARHGEASAHLVVRGENSLGVGHQESSRRIRQSHLHLADGVTARARHFVGAHHQFDLLGLGHVRRRHLGARRIVAQALEFHLAHSPSTLTRDGGGGSSGRQQSRFREVRGVREPGGLADHDSHTSPTRSARTQLLDTSLIQRRRCVGAILHEDFGEISASAH